MTRTIPLLLLSAALAAGCTAFEPPPIVCNLERVQSGLPDDGVAARVTADLYYGQPAAGLPCDFGDAYYLATVTHRISVDPRFDEKNETSKLTDYSLANTKVKVVRSSPAILLCPGPDCSPAMSTLETTLDENAALTYTLSLDLEAGGMMPPPGSTASFRGSGVSEEYGSGDACRIEFDISVTCVKASQ